MSKRRKRRRRGKGRSILLVLALLWAVLEGRFYIPKYIRPPEGIRPIEVAMKTTAYCHCRKCCSYKWFLFVPYQKTGFAAFRFKQVGKTSSGAMVRPGTIAADTTFYPYGTVMYIPGYGYGRVEDTGGAIKGRHIDLYRPNHWVARHWGVQTKKVKVWLPSAAAPWSFNPLGEKMNAVSNMLPENAVLTNEVPSSVDEAPTNETKAATRAAETNESPLQIPLP